MQGPYHCSCERILQPKVCHFRAKQWCHPTRACPLSADQSAARLSDRAAQQPVRSCKRADPAATLGAAGFGRCGEGETNRTKNTSLFWISRQCSHCPPPTLDFFIGCSLLIAWGISATGLRAPSCDSCHHCHSLSEMGIGPDRRRRWDHRPGLRAL